MTETEFQANVIELARMLGWHVAHFRPARTKHGWKTPLQGDPGFPDLVLAKDGQVIFAELKSEKGKLTEAQESWLKAVDGHVWRPSDIDAIGKLLTLGFG